MCRGCGEVVLSNGGCGEVVLSDGGCGEVVLDDTNILQAREKHEQICSMVRPHKCKYFLSYLIGL